MKAFVIAFALLAASPALSQNAALVYPVESQSQSRSGVAPTAADKKLGMALRSAVVADNGTLVSGAGAVSVTKIAVGVYNVLFERSIAGCSFSVTAANTQAGTGMQAATAAFICWCSARSSDGRREARAGPMGYA
jgi:hypothetical protein